VSGPGVALTSCERAALSELLVQAVAEIQGRAFRVPVEFWNSERGVRFSAKLVSTASGVIAQVVDIRSGRCVCESLPFDLYSVALGGSKPCAG
jgi:hypothetical protein